MFLTAVANDLARRCRAEGLTRILLTTRDGCLLGKVLAALHPEFEVLPYNTSRIMYRENNAAHDAYVLATYKPGTTLIFDMNGSFRTGRPLFLRLFGKLPRVHLFNFDMNAPTFDGLTFSTTTYGYDCETYSIDVCGVMVDIDDHWNVYRAPPMYDIADVQDGHKAVDMFAKYLGRHAVTLRSLFLSPEQCGTLSVSVGTYNTLCSVRTVADDNVSLTELANRFETDKGTAHGRKHHYTKHYQKLFHRFGTLSSLKLLAVGLNQPGQVSMPSIEIWKAYFGTRLQVVGFDNAPGFQEFDGKGQRVVIGEQSNAADLARVAREGPFDIIIDDGSHGSRDQQVSLLHLWDSLKSGGMYVIESLHLQPEPETGVKTRELLLAWAAGKPLSTEYLPLPHVSRIRARVKSTQFFDSGSSLSDGVFANAFVALVKL